MHYAEFAEDESAALLAAIKEYEANKWKVIGQKVNKPAKVSSSSSPGAHLSGESARETNFLSQQPKPCSLPTSDFPIQSLING